MLPLVRIESRLFGDQIVSMPYSSLGSVLVGDDRAEETTAVLLDSAIEFADQTGVDHLSLRGRDLGERDRLTKKRRYVTFRVQLDRDPGDIWDSMKASRQRQVRQAIDDDSLTFEVGTSLSDLREFYQLYLRTMRGHGSPPHDFEFFRTLWERYSETGVFRLGLIRMDGRIINGVLDLALGDRIAQHTVVSEYEERDRNGGSLLHWKSLEWGAKNGYEAYNFGRTREGSGVYMFKKSFGGEKVWLDDYHYFPGDPVDLTDAEDDEYDAAKRVWRRLPIPVTRIIGPYLRKQISL
ncbi:GNAT family N-acetyltransferase [Halorubellus salinus]|uniref:GNAT family N-acetyltransferase n=1 Tax=Halorubellus salinus TaxID=755309 RepID=UPI001D05F46D|nr:GNAT family N-acetyltransferase [Halorubellus salinus]